jgi:hypothetical protein
MASEDQFEAKITELCTALGPPPKQAAVAKVALHTNTSTGTTKVITNTTNAIPSTAGANKAGAVASSSPFGQLASTVAPSVHPLHTPVAAAAPAPPHLTPSGGHAHLGQQQQQQQQQHGGPGWQVQISASFNQMATYFRSIHPPHGAQLIGTNEVAALQTRLTELRASHLLNSTEVILLENTIGDFLRVKGLLKVAPLPDSPVLPTRSCCGLWRRRSTNKVKPAASLHDVAVVDTLSALIALMEGLPSDESFARQVQRYLKVDDDLFS